MAKRKDSDSPEGKKASALESALAGGVEGGTLGFAGELAGASTAFETDPALMEFNPMAASDEDIKRAREPVVDKYKARKQALDSYLARVESDNPEAFLGGNIAGGVATSLLTPVSPVADLAINAIGTSEADLTKGDVGGLSEDVAANIALGKAGEKAIKAAGGSRVLKRGGQHLEELLNKARVESAPIRNKIETAAYQKLMNAAENLGIVPDVRLAREAHLENPGLPAKMKSAASRLKSKLENWNLPDTEPVKPNPRFEELTDILRKKAS